jgi:hypothetical protein
MNLLSAAVAASFATLLTACPLLEVTADIPEVCMVYKDIPVEGLPTDGVETLTQTFAFDDLSAFDQIKDLDADVRFKSASLTATSGVADFAFLSAAKLDVTSGTDASLPRRNFYHCDGDCPRAGDTVVIPVADQDDAFSYIRSGALVIDLDVTGHLPATAWTMDATICVEGSATYSQ